MDSPTASVGRTFVGSAEARLFGLGASRISCMACALAFAAVCTLPASLASALEISSYYSPRSAGRPVRAETRYIVLHTTEGPRSGSLQKIHDNGEAHYFVDESGHIYRVVRRDRIATHAGRSMWKGRTNIDEVSVAIEVVGYHNRDITQAQYVAVRELVGYLQQIYRIPDCDVLCHGMVAYGSANRWHPRPHRGRKRCGMIFGLGEVRARLGLTEKPACDPDVAAGRLMDADPYLSSMFYRRGQQRTAPESAVSYSGGSGDGQNMVTQTRSPWQIAGDAYNSGTTLYVFPDGRKMRGNQITDWKHIPRGTKILVAPESRSERAGGDDLREIGRDGDTAREAVGAECLSRSTLYILPDRVVRRGDQLSERELARLPVGTKILVGYAYGGRLATGRTPFDICGKRWNHPSTIYMLPSGKLRAGNTVSGSDLVQGTAVFVRS